MNLDLQNKIVFITGASSGIGAAAAEIFSAEGADVVISFGRILTVPKRPPRKVQGKRAAGLAVSDGRQRSGQRGRGGPPASARNQGLDALVLCAGLSLHTEFEDITPEEWNRVIAVNLNGAFYTLQALTPLLRDGAAVVMVSSVSAQTGVSHQAHYAAAKAGLVNLTKSAARALAPRIRVNCVTPGITMTPMGLDTIDALDPIMPKTRCSCSATPPRRKLRAASSSWPVRPTVS